MEENLAIGIGDKFYYYDRDVWHIINIFNDDKYTMIVIKSWSKYKARWDYKVEYLETIKWWLNTSNQLQLNKKDNMFYIKKRKGK